MQKKNHKQYIQNIKLCHSFSIWAEQLNLGIVEVSMNGINVKLEVEKGRRWKKEEKKTTTYPRVKLKCHSCRSFYPQLEWSMLCWHSICFGMTLNMRWHAKINLNDFYLNELNFSYYIIPILDISKYALKHTKNSYGGFNIVFFYFVFPHLIILLSISNWIINNFIHVYFNMHRSYRFYSANLFTYKNNTIGIR